MRLGVSGLTGAVEGISLRGAFSWLLRSPWGRERGSSPLDFSQRRGAPRELLVDVILAPGAGSIWCRGVRHTAEGGTAREQGTLGGPPSWLHFQQGPGEHTCFSGPRN